jgi:hypothetical protein
LKIPLTKKRLWIRLLLLKLKYWMGKGSRGWAKIDQDLIRERGKWIERAWIWESGRQRFNCSFQNRQLFKLHVLVLP